MKGANLDQLAFISTAMGVTVNTPQSALLAGATQVCQQSLHKLLYTVRRSWSIVVRLSRRPSKYWRDCR